MKKNMALTNAQVSDLARPLVSIIQTFYANPENEKGFQKWLLNVEKQKRESTDTKS